MYFSSHFASFNRCFQLLLIGVAQREQLVTERMIFREALVPAEEMASLAPQETPAPLDLQDRMDPLDLVE